MKKIFYIIAVIIFLPGCQEDNQPASEVVGEWQLIQSHHYVGTEVIREGEDLEWQEVYVFRSDGKFAKTRTTSSGNLNASGTYMVEDAPLYLSRPVKLLLKLTFTTGDGLAGGCSPGTEEFDLSSHDGMVRNYSIACQNPILTYQKK
ncbi:hypothetical protein [Anditalea andensis]|uniref:Lipocalin-like domain-containing protein n=1 Tax=Anditalea andensis TaxID=1048983 RepID=A0A074L480_9BACT|nr:hypothetical protein [Anditalea andensis]KEO74623.1 hypothetical protein EL17_02815 [Anditalea andensis]